jgi:hypothetical protein
VLGVVAEKSFQLLMVLLEIGSKIGSSRSLIEQGMTEYGTLE